MEAAVDYIAFPLPSREPVSDPVQWELQSDIQNPEVITKFGPCVAILMRTLGNLQSPDELIGSSVMACFEPWPCLRTVKDECIPLTKKPKASFSRNGSNTPRLAGSNRDASHPLALHHTSQQDDDLGKLQ